MTPEEIQEVRESFLAERISIMCAEGMEEQEAIETAEKCWLKYARYHGLIKMEQRKI